MKCKTSELTCDKLNYAVALAQGWQRDSYYDPVHNWEQCGPLLEKYYLSIHPRFIWIDDVQQWAVHRIVSEKSKTGGNDVLGITGADIKDLICRCVVASVFGEYVDMPDD